MHTWSHDGESFEQVLLIAEMNPSLDTAAHAAWTIASAYPLIPFFTPKEKSTNEIYVSFFCLEVFDPVGRGQHGENITVKIYLILAKSSFLLLLILKIHVNWMHNYDIHRALLQNCEIQDSIQCKMGKGPWVRPIWPHSKKIFFYAFYVLLSYSTNPKLVNWCLKTSTNKKSW